LKRSSAAFAALLLIATGTSLLAVSGLVSSTIQAGSLSAASTTSSSTLHSGARSTSSSVVSSSTTSQAPAATTSSVATTSSITTESSAVTSVASSTVSSVTTVATTATSTATSVVGAGTTTGTVAATVTSTGAPSSVVTSVVTSTTSGVTYGPVGTTANSSLAGLAGSFGAASGGESLLREMQAASLFLAPLCWILVGGAWVWRGRVRARYSEMGFGSDVFELFMKMKGGATRVKVLNLLSSPKDRLQIANELGVDWKTIDRHVKTLNKYGFVREQAEFGSVRLYEVTPLGKMILNLFDELEATDGPVVPNPATPEERLGT